VLHVRADSDYPAHHKQQNPLEDVYPSRLSDVRPPLADRKPPVKRNRRRESTGYSPAVIKEETLEQHLAHISPSGLQKAILSPSLEIQKGSKNKYELDKETGLIILTASCTPRRTTPRTTVYTAHLRRRQRPARCVVLCSRGACAAEPGALLPYRHDFDDRRRQERREDYLHPV
jgi:hypothetical protein